MKYLALILLISAQLFGLNIYLNSAKESGLPYAILHIIDNDSIKCQTLSLAYDKKSYICEFDKIIKNPIEEKRLRLVDIDFLEKSKKFYIKIDPKYSSKLFSLNEKLYKTKEVMDEKKSTKSKHWVVLLYKKPPFGGGQESEGINFPITYDKYLLPSIGSVDLNGAPISYVKSKDINYYLDIQQEFKDKDYEDVIKDVDRTLKQYPKSIFKSDLLLYKLKSMDKGIEKNIEPISDKYTNDDVIKLAKSWLRAFSSNDNIPQVLLILVKSYLRSDSSSDTNYFLDILITEHKDSPYTKKAILYFADSIYKKNDKNRAMKLYEDVLYSAKDLDIASLAAIKLAKSNINLGKVKKAKEYLQKVLQANKNYLLKDRDATKKLAAKLAKNGLDKIAATINDLLLSHLDKGEVDERELLLKQAGDWYAKAGDISRAYARYQTYQKLYKDGVYIDEVNRAVDRLFFKMKDTNETKLLKYYDLLISKYNNDIKDKAIIEKAKLLLKQKRYKSILKMKKMLKSAEDSNSTVANSLIEKASIMLIDGYVKKQECQNAVGLIEENKIKPEELSDKDGVFDCFIMTSRYKKAMNLAKDELKSKKLDKNFKWLQNLILSEYKLHKYSKVLELKSDLYNLSALLKKPIKISIYRILFNSMMKQKEFNQALSVVQKIEKLAPKDVKNIDIYYQIVEYANSMRNDILLMQYAKKIIDLQKLYKIDDYSPKIDFYYIDSLKRLSKIKEAKKATQRLLKLKLKESDKSRVLYELGELSLKLKEPKEAKKWFQKCSKAKTKDSWSSLCTESLKIF